MARVLLIAVSLAVPILAGAATSTGGGFHRDVLPILQKHCQTCHRPGEVGPMPLLTYQQVRPWAKAIRSAVLLKKMPPWFADPEHGKFSNDRSLSRAEIDGLVAWVDNGAPEGDPKEGPKPLEFADGWRIGKPDVVLEVPIEYHVPANGVIPYQYIVFPTGFTEDKWVQAVEVRPGNPSVVHHQIATVRPHKESEKQKHGEYFDLEGVASRPGADHSRMFSASPDAETLHVYVPGGIAPALKPGQARLIKAGSDIMFQLHYTTKGQPATDRTRVGFIFAKQPPTERIRTVLVYNTAFTIPAGDPNASVEARAMVKQDLKLTALLPHMHLRGKDFEFRAIYPDGKSEILLSVPRYDFHWQLTYFLETPKLLPAGTILECLGHYDNSPNNPNNPDPKSVVHYGDQTFEEMLNGFMDVAIDPNPKSPEIFGPAPASVLASR